MAKYGNRLASLERKQAALVRPATGQDGTGAVTTTQAVRKSVMTPCETREELQGWLRRYLNLDLPNQKVDPDSTGSPFDHLWEVYHAMVTNDESFPRRLMLYASRASYKTLVASVLELLAMIHADRSVVHMAAIEQQAGKAQEYLRGFLSRDGLDEFSVGNNKRSVAVVWAQHRKTGDIITNDEWRKMDRPLRRDYVYHVHYVKVIVNTAQSANSDHVALLVVDEVDLIRFPLAYDEAKLIPETQVTSEGVEQPPITVLTSSRKYSGGLVQREIDEAKDTGTVIKHWNILDVSRRCPDERHRPDLPKREVYVCNEGMKVIQPDEYERILEQDEKAAQDYKLCEVYQGCLDNCPNRVCAGCKGMLAGVTSQAKMLKGIKDVISKFIEVSVSMCEAQVMCWKPGNEASIYKHFSRKKHMLTVAEMWKTITAQDAPKHATKQDLIGMLKSRNVKWAVGMDWGFTHVFAICLFAIDGQRAFLIEAYEIPHLELNQKVEYCDKRIKPYKPVVWPDPAYPSDIETFRKKGYLMKTHTKDVLGGINVVRNKLDSPSHEPELFMLKDDPAGELMCKRIESYRWKLDAQGRPTDEPDDFEDDLCFTADTEVLTRDGWVHLDEVHGDREVMAVTADGKGRLELPEKVVARSYTGEMISLKHHHLEFTATADHEHAVMRQIDWKVKGLYLLQKRTVAQMDSEMYWANNLSEWAAGPGVFPQGEDEAWLAGFWLAEGCFDIHRPTYIIVDQKKPQHIDTLMEVVRRLGWRWSRTDKKSGVARFVFSEQGSRAALWRARFGALCEDKKLPLDVVLQMSQAERRAMWEGYMAGDGCRTQSAWHFDTVSSALADGVQWLTLALGMGCRTISYDCFRAGRVLKFPQGHSSLGQQSIRGHVLRKRPIAHVQRRRFVRSQYSGMVYCVRTSTGFFLARTNGKVFVAGNCDALRYCIANEFRNSGRVVVAKDLPAHVLAAQQAQGARLTPKTWMSEKIAELTGGANGQAPETKRIKKGGFYFDGS